MAKKKKGGKASGGGGGKTPAVENVQIEFPPQYNQMTMLYRKASFEVLPNHTSSKAREEEKKTKLNLLEYQLDKAHRAIVPGYCKFLRDRKFWMVGDEVPDGAIPKIPAPPKPKGDAKKKKK